MSKTLLKLTFNGTDINLFDGDFDSLDAFEATTRFPPAQVGSFPLNGPGAVNITLSADTRAEINHPGAKTHDDEDVAQSILICELDLFLRAPNAPPIPPEQPTVVEGRVMEFSIDIGGDRELSDHQQDGNELLDPGDIYLHTFPPRTELAGACTPFRDDGVDLFAGDPLPDPANPNSRAPVCSTTNSTFIEGSIVPFYFDLDAVDVVDFSLSNRQSLDPNPATTVIERFQSSCVPPGRFLMVSFDDDSALPYAFGSSTTCSSTPTAGPSDTGRTYGKTENHDEVLGVITLPRATWDTVDGAIPVPPSTPAMNFGIFDEFEFNNCLGPNPGTQGGAADDDVDGLDIHGTQTGSTECNRMYFSVDHEATAGLDPGAIYEDFPSAGFGLVVDPVQDLGFPIGTGVDIDAFEFVWTVQTNAPNPGTVVLTLLYSVASNDFFVDLNVDESGGLDPAMIYYSYLDGAPPKEFLGRILPDNSFEPEPLQDNIDGITAWWTPLAHENPRVCPPAFEWGFRGSGGPPSRESHAMAYDPVRQRVVLFGGNNVSGGLQDTWEWDGSSWVFRTTIGPGARIGHGMAADPVAGVVMFGGRTLAASFFDDTWKWNGSTWTPVSAGVPSARRGLAMALDPANGRTVLVGGSIGGVFDDTWTWDGNAWALLSGGSPGFRQNHAMAHDAARARTVLFGGFPLTDDTWELGGGNWAQVSTSGAGLRLLHAMAYDASRGVTVLFGGNNSLTPRMDDTWLWDGAVWAQLDTTGPRPSERFSHAMAYDAARRQVVLFGGNTATGFSSETWVFPTASVTRAFHVLGSSSGIGWSWCINELPGPGFSVCDLSVPGVPAPGNATTLVNQFVDTINASGCPGVRAVANGSVFTVTIGGNQGFSFCVGPFGQQPGCCFPPALTCSFNPDMEEVVLTGLDCNGNGIDDAIDIANGSSVDMNANGVPDECDCSRPNPPQPDIIQAKNRYLSFSAVEPGRLQAVRVTFVDLPGPLAALNGTAMWVGPTFQVSELSGKNDTTPPTFTASTLDCLEHFTDWATLGVVHVSHAFIVPGGIYDIQLLDEVCSVGGEAGFSAALRVINSRWGDVVGPFEAGAWTAPDDAVSVAFDVVSILDKFSNAPLAPQKSRVDIEPDPVDGKVSILDVTLALDAFSGGPFPFNPVSVEPCP